MKIYLTSTSSNVKDLYQGLKITHKQSITIKTKTSAVSSSKPGGGSGEAGSAGTSALGPGVK